VTHRGPFQPHHSMILWYPMGWATQSCPGLES